MAISKIDPNGLDLTGDVAVDTDTLVVDSTNNRVGIGTSSPSNLLTLQGSGTTRLVIDARTSASNGELASLQLWSKNSGGTNNYGYIDYDGDGNMEIGSGGSGASAVNMVFDTAGSERMRITSSGKLLCGITSDTTTANEGISIRGSDGLIDMFTTNGQEIMRFYKQNGNQNGSIQMNASSVSYNTSSDYRLKENVTAITDGIERMKRLSVHRFNFIADPDTTVDGFLAHEAATVVPEAVTGTHNEVETWTQEEIDAGDAPANTSAGDNKLDEDGNTIPVYQGIDQSKLVPLLTGALQEAIAKIETLETTVADLQTRVTALEAN